MRMFLWNDLNRLGTHQKMAKTNSARTSVFLKKKKVLKRSNAVGTNNMHSMLLETESTLEFVQGNAGSGLGHLLLDARRQLFGRVDGHPGDGFGIHRPPGERVSMSNFTTSSVWGKNEGRATGSGCERKREIGDKRTQVSTIYGYFFKWAAALLLLTSYRQRKRSYPLLLNDNTRRFQISTIITKSWTGLVQKSFVHLKIGNDIQMNLFKKGRG